MKASQTRNSEIVAIDLGGTWIRSALVIDQSVSTEIERTTVYRTQSAEAICSDVITHILAMRTKRTKAVCIGVPMCIQDNGALGESDNLPTLGGFHPIEYIQERVCLPVRLVNDALAFTVGEWSAGAGAESETVCGITLGTGIGCGLIIGGCIHKGCHGFAGEIWRSAGISGTIEDSVSGPAIERRATVVFGRETSGPQIRELAASGNRQALDVYGEFGRNLGTVVAFVVNLLDPELVVFGGAVSDAWSFFNESMMTTIREFTTGGTMTRFEPTRLGVDAPLIGAAVCLSMNKTIKNRRTGKNI